MFNLNAELKKVAEKIKAIAESIKTITSINVVPINIQRSFTSSTGMADTGIKVTIPANSYFVLFGTAIWANSRPVAIYLTTTNQALYAHSEGYTEHENASASLAMFTDVECVVQVKARYISAATNLAILRGFYFQVSSGGGYFLTLLRRLLRGGACYA